LAVNNTKRDAFGDYHPIVNMCYFVAVIGFSMFFMHPVSLMISFVCAFSYALYLNGRRMMRMSLIFMLPVLLLTSVLNPLFNHQGATILAYLPNGNPLTLESTMFGIATAVMFISVIAWFSCFNSVMTSDKFVYLLGRIIPALSLILSMSLRFVPRFVKQAKIIANAQKCIGRDIGSGNILQRAKHGIKILSILVTWALENAIETADSMKARGYGIPGRTAFSIYRFNKRDSLALLFIIAVSMLMLLGAFFEVYRFRFFPTIRHFTGDFPAVFMPVLFMLQLILFLLPLIVNVKEELSWTLTQSKI